MEARERLSEEVPPMVIDTFIDGLRLSLAPPQPGEIMRVEVILENAPNRRLVLVRKNEEWEVLVRDRNIAEEDVARALDLARESFK